MRYFFRKCNETRSRAASAENDNEEQEEKEEEEEEETVADKRTATLPPDRVNYGTISSGRYISPRLRAAPRLSILALASSLPADSPLVRRGERGTRSPGLAGSVRGRARAFARIRKLRKGTGRLVNHRRNGSLCLVRVGLFVLLSFFFLRRFHSTTLRGSVLYVRWISLNRKKIRAFTIFEI